MRNSQDPRETERDCLRNSVLRSLETDQMEEISSDPQDLHWDSLGMPPTSDSRDLARESHLQDHHSEVQETSTSTKDRPMGYSAMTSSEDLRIRDPSDREMTWWATKWEEGNSEPKMREDCLTDLWELRTPLQVLEEEEILPSREEDPLVSNEVSELESFSIASHQCKFDWCFYVLLFPITP